MRPEKFLNRLTVIRRRDTLVERADFNECYDTLQAALRQRDALRAALERVEWVGELDAEISWCPWCMNVDYKGHAPDCQRQRALAVASEEVGGE